MYKKVEII